MEYDENYDEYYVVGGCGSRVYAGDYVQCLTSQYSSIAKSERRRVQCIKDGNIVLNNGYSPHGTSQYRPHNFRLAGRYHPYHACRAQAQDELNRLQRQSLDIIASESKVKSMINKPVLYVAVQIGNAAYNEVAALINDNPSKLATFSDTSYDALQARLRQRILTYPTERWLILSGTTLAEVSAPPVIFRSA